MSVYIRNEFHPHFGFVVSCLLIYLATCPSSPTSASGVTINSVPSVPVEGSTLTFTCTLTGESIVSTCDSGGHWSPDPGAYDCSGKKLHRIETLSIHY